MSARKMKDSGNQWIGKIPEEWEMRKIKFVANISTGNTPSKNNEEYYSEQGLNWVKPDNLKGFNEIRTTEERLSNEGQKVARIAPANSVLVCCIGTIGKIGYSSESVAYNQQINAVTFSEKLNWKYGMYFLSSQQEQARFYMNGNVVFILNAENQKKIEITLPDFKVQQKIVNYLDEKCAAIDKIVASKQKQNEQLAEYRQSLITEAVTKGLKPSAPMKDSGIEWIGQIPKEWKVCKIKYLSEMKSGESITSSEIVEAGQYPVYGGNGLRGYTSTYTNDGKHILIGRQGALCGNVRSVEGKFWATEHAVVVYEHDNIDVNWFNYSLEAMNLNQYSTSAAQPGLSVEQITNILACVPPLAEQKEIASYLDKKCGEIDALSERNKNIIESLQEYKQSLIYEAVTGKIEL